MGEYDAGTLSVSNGTLLVSNSRYERVSSEPAGVDLYPAFSADVRFKYGGASTNCIVRLSGTNPRIACVGGSSAELQGQTLFLCNPPPGLTVLFQ